MRRFHFVFLNQGENDLPAKYMYDGDNITVQFRQPDDALEAAFESSFGSRPLDWRPSAAATNSSDVVRFRNPRVVSVHVQRLGRHRRWLLDLTALLRREPGMLIGAISPSSTNS